MKEEVIWKAIDFCRSMDDETITIGGGEPTLHPLFFDILKECLEKFRYVWMATNGSQTKIMYRLYNILLGDDFECKCQTEEEMENCTCGEDSIYAEDRLGVALSLDHFHDSIDSNIVNLWKRQANQHKRTGFEIRDVTKSYHGPIAEGRGKRTGAGYSDGCVCSDILIRLDGKIKL